MKITDLVRNIESISSQCHEELMASMDNIDSVLALMTLRHTMLEDLFSRELSEADYKNLSNMLVKVRNREEALLEPYRRLHQATRESILNFNKITMYLEA